METPPSSLTDSNRMLTLAGRIKQWSAELGFQQTGITDTNLELHETRLLNWLGSGMHGSMAYMERHGTRRSRPQELVSGTIRIITVRMDYWPDPGAEPFSVLENPDLAYVSRYATGRDYHKLMRKRLQQLATLIEDETGPFGYRAFVDSAPVLEKALAEKSGLGWIGKHSNLINAKKGSWFFLGELYTNLPLPIDEPAINHCGSCRACIDACPTDAIVEPYVVDARRCISYLTIENRGSIPEEFRKAMGNRIYGCDDCQLVCPWNRFSQPSAEKDFQIRHQLDQVSLLELFALDENTFNRKMEGSPIRRIGYESWIRNIAVALGNAPASENVINALQQKRLNSDSTLIREHVQWALAQHGVLE